jgi:hypothetical protein
VYIEVNSFDRLLNMAGGPDTPAERRIIGRELAWDDVPHYAE